MPTQMKWQTILILAILQILRMDSQSLKGETLQNNKVYFILNTLEINI